MAQKITATTQSSSKSIKSQEQSTTMSASSKGSQETTDNYIIIWLDPNLDFTNQENQELISQLRSIVRTIKTFTDLDQCTKFLQQIKDKKIFLIISDYFIKQIASFEEQFTQLHSIYIFCNQKSKYDQIIKAYKKGRGVFTHLKSLCHELKKEIRQLNNDAISISIVPASSTTNLNELDPSFMYFQLLKENLLSIEYNHEMEIQQLVDYCRPQYNENEADARNIVDFEHRYDQYTPIWWYTLESFLYKMLNHALRNFDIEILVKTGFFIQDLHKQIKQRHAELDLTQIPPVIYRGQGMLNADFEKLKKAKNGFLFFNSFFSTTTEESVARGFAERNQNDPNKKVVLLEIALDTSISSVPFTPVKDVSAIPSEDEILFSMSTVFRIMEIKEIENHTWKVNLSLTSDRDPLLKRLTDHVRISLGDGNGWRRLSQLMIKMGKFDKAIEFYKILLKTVDLDDKAENAFLHNQIGYAYKQMDNLTEACSHYKQSLDISRSYLSSPIDSKLSSIYSNIGGIYKKLGHLNEALESFQLVLKIDLAAQEPNPLEIAIDHNNIGSVLDDQGKYPEALKCYEQALEIKLTHLPPHHASLASTYSNIGLIHRKMGDCSTALLFYEKALTIQEKSLTSNHPSLVVTHRKMASALEDLHRYEEAIKHAQQAVDIAGKAFGASHPEVEKRQKYLKELQLKM